MKNYLNLALQAIILFCIVSISTTSFSQNAQMTWSNWFSNGSLSSRDYFIKAIQNSSGGIYVTGSTEKDISNFDITTMSFSISGDLIWKRDYSIFNGGYSLEDVVDMHVDKDDNLYIVGHTYDPSDRIILALKYDKHGTLQWERLLDNELYYGAKGIIADEHGNAYLSIIGSIPIIKLDKYGKYTKEIDPKNEREINKIIYSEDHYIYAFSESLSENHEGELEIFKIDTTGNVIWQNNYPYDDMWKDINELVDVKFDSEQNIYVLTNIYTEHRRFDDTQAVMLQKINSEGLLKWVTVYNGQQDDIDDASTLQIIGDSSVFVGGQTMTDSSYRDIFLFEYDSSGTLLDSFKYNSPFNQSDYLFSVSFDSNLNKFLTTTSFIDNYQFYTSILKINRGNNIQREQKSTLSLSNRVYPETSFLNFEKNRVFIFGNLCSTNNTDLPYDTESDYWIMQIDSSGILIEENTFGDIGTTNIYDSFITMDKQKNIYTSSKVRKGPRYFNGEYYYNFFLTLNKLDSLGNELWSIEIDNEPDTEQDYLGHFMVLDSIIIMVGNIYHNNTNYTTFYKYNIDGVKLAEKRHPNTYRSIYNTKVNSSGAIYTYEQIFGSDSSKIRKFHPDFSLDWQINTKQNSSSRFNGVFEIEKSNTLLFANGDGSLFRISEIGVIEKIGDFPGISDIVSNNDSTILLCGGGSTSFTGAIRKLSYYGEEIWSFIGSGLIAKKIVTLSNGNIAMMGPACSILNCSPSKVFLVTSEGEEIYSRTYNISFKDAAVASDDKIIINGGDNLLRLKSNLNWDSYLRYDNDTTIVEYSIDDFLIDNENNVYSTGGAGNLTFLNTHLWNALLTAKFDNENTNPYFTAAKNKFGMAKTDSLYFDYNALDRENDELFFSCESLPAFLELDSITGILSGKIENHIPADYSFKVFVTDIHGANSVETVNLRVGNLPPQISGLAVDSIEIEVPYFYKALAEDPEYDALTYEVEIESLWYNCNSLSGFITGTPLGDDIGSYLVNLKVSDEFGGSAMHPFTIIVFSNEVIDTADDTSPIIEFTTISSSGVESITSVDIPVELSDFSDKEVSVDYTISGTAEGGGIDYILGNGELTFNAGLTSKSIMIGNIVDDDVFEEDETIIITLANPVNASLGANNVHTYTIINDDNFISSVNETPNEFSIFPNPVNSKIYISKSDKSPLEYVIINTDGNIVLKGSTVDGIINVNSLHEGVYFIKYANSIEKIIKK